jgi:hypothetical protein
MTNRLRLLRLYRAEESANPVATISFNDRCDICEQQPNNCVVFDNSSDEYTGTTICFTCLRNFIGQFSPRALSPMKRASQSQSKGES